MDDKVYTNETISDTPFPNQPDSATVTDSTPSLSRSKPAGQTTIPQQSFIQKNISVETESQALNTRTKKIIQEFQFTPSGAIQIGDFENGVSGDIRIDPNGILARNLLGDTTFALDGDTGDAIFKGIIQAKDFIVVDTNGLVSLASFHSATLNHSTFANTNSADAIQISNTQLSFTLERTTNVLVLLSASYFMHDIASGVTAEGNIYLGLDGEPYQTAFYANDSRQGANAAAFYQAWSRSFSSSFNILLTLPPGPHTIDVWMAIDDDGIVNIYVGDIFLTYVILGS